MYIIHMYICILIFQYIYVYIYMYIYIYLYIYMYIYSILQLLYRDVMGPARPAATVSEPTWITPRRNVPVVIMTKCSIYHYNTK